MKTIFKVLTLGMICALALSSCNLNDSNDIFENVQSDTDEDGNPILRDTITSVDTSQEYQN